MAVGTVAYMSPEHARGEAIDQRSDLFSLGVVMYEMATGVQTFKGQTTAVIFDQILNRVPVPPSTINPDVIPTLEHIIGRLLEKDRERRYQSSRDVQADLQRLKRDLDAKRVVTADAAQTSTPATWTPFENARSASTVAVNLPTFGVEAEPAPVPAAWAVDWNMPRPSSKPDVDREAASASAPVPSRAVSATATLSGEIASAPTMMVPVSGSARDGPEPHAPSAAAATAAARGRAASGRAGRTSNRVSPTSRTRRTPTARRRPSDAPSPSAPARPTRSRTSAVGSRQRGSSSPARPPRPGFRRPRPRPRRRGRRGPHARGRRPVVGPPGPRGIGQRRRAASRTGRHADAGTDAVHDPGRDSGSAADGTTAPIVPPDDAGRAGQARDGDGQSAARRARHRSARDDAAGRWRRHPAGRPPRNRQPSKAMLAQAATMLSEAQGLLQTGAEADGLARIAALRASFGGTPSAREGALLAARTHQQAKRYDEAGAAWLDAARDGVGPEDISEGLIQAADGAARQRSTEGDGVARRTLGEILDRYPASVRALRALQMKMSIEDRMKLKEPDGELNGVAPTSLLTLRKAARGAGTAPVAEFALWRLGQEYRERRLYDLAATTFADLGTRFPETRYEAWFSAAELFEKQLKDTARAREAYAKVPAASPRYEAAQKKLTSA